MTRNKKNIIKLLISNLILIVIFSYVIFNSITTNHEAHVSRSSIYVSADYEMESKEISFLYTFHANLKSSFSQKCFDQYFQHHNKLTRLNYSFFNKYRGSSDRDKVVENRFFNRTQTNQLFLLATASTEKYCREEYNKISTLSNARNLDVDISTMAERAIEFFYRNIEREIYSDIIHFVKYGKPKSLKIIIPSTEVDKYKKELQRIVKQEKSRIINTFNIQKFNNFNIELNGPISFLDILGKAPFEELFNFYDKRVFLEIDIKPITIEGANQFNTHRNTNAALSIGIVLAVILLFFNFIFIKLFIDIKMLMKLFKRIIS